MTTWAIGDLQGCAAELEDLLEAIAYTPGRDHLVFLGDLVNRGPDSLGALRRVRELGARTVLGNHDLHLLAQAEGFGGPARQRDTLEAILAAPDRDALLDWLRAQPLLIDTPAMLYVHAGLAAQWRREDAVACAREVESVLHGPEFRALLAGMYGDAPAIWDPALAGMERLRFIINALTRIRYCGRDGAMAMQDKGPPGTQDAALLPWYAVPGRRSAGVPICFGHWSTLRLGPDQEREHRVHALDTGCVWGGELTALEVETGRRYSVPSRRTSSTKL